MAPITMKSWPLLTTLLVLLFGLLASATQADANSLVKSAATLERHAERLAVRAPKGGKGGGGGGSGGGDDDDDDDDDKKPINWQDCRSGSTCAECFGKEYVNCLSPANVCYNPATQSRSDVCREPPKDAIKQGSNDPKKATTNGPGANGASQLTVMGPVTLGALGLAVAML
ncbi:hypothetical protein AJ79_00274 [Helicocarpus griseus UAMH5409]|uniref:Uncharacterized protein n=1 Tax=Helicocarpus griseus UAMH5409 TaxID=1447875 RepID=A0A2B7YCS2_9EURO|nr:hypothetical protein AJ79_00274 [Helicocarpus griseus UAMH5409]